jgi:hypothetical protein
LLLLSLASDETHLKDPRPRSFGTRPFVVGIGDSLV